MALHIARTSAPLISVGGIGDEKRHWKLPSWFRKTPPTAKRDSDGMNEASTFHFKHSMRGGGQEARDG